MTTNFWHERSYYNNLATTSRDDMHLANSQVFAFGKNLVGSRADGKIYYFDKNVYTDAGHMIRRIRTAPHMHEENKRAFFKSLELDVEKGIGLTTGQGSVPNIMLQYSNDGGFNWSAELWRSAGRIGEFRTRVKWFNLGMARDRVFRIVYTDAVSCHLINAWIDTEVER
jgi:hypothetical protein